LESTVSTNYEKKYAFTPLNKFVENDIYDIEINHSSDLLKQFS